MQKPKIIALIILACLFTGLFISHKYRAPIRKYADFNCFYISGQRMLAHKNIYVIRDQETAEFRYTPVFALVMSGLALANEGVADSIWFTLNFLLMAASFICLKKSVIRDGLKAKSTFIFYLLLILGSFRFIMHNLDAGQSNILMLASIIFGLYLIEKGKEAEGGAIFAFSIMIKYTPLLFIPYFFLKRKFKVGLFITATVLFYLLLPALFIGFKTNLAYLKDLLPFLTNSTILDPTTILNYKNQSLLSMIARNFSNCSSIWPEAGPMPFQGLNLSPQGINLIFLAASLLVYIPAILPKKCDTYIDYSLLTICVILFNLNAWKPTFVLLFIPYFIILYYLAKTGFRNRIGVSLIAASFFLNIITMNSIFGKALSYKLWFYSPLTISALITYVILLKIKFTQIRT